MRGLGLACALCLAACGAGPRPAPAPAPAAPAATGEAPDIPCTRLEELPYQQVADARLVHLGDGPGWAGAHVRLCPREEPVLGYRFVVRQAGATLDCGGVVFDGGPVEGARPRIALDVDKRAEPAVADVVVRRCELRGYARGVWLVGPDIAAEDAETRALARIRLEDVAVVDSEDVGIYVGPHSRDFVLSRVRVERARLTGLYLDAYSRGVRVENSRFLDNGWSACSLGREGIAIDASSHHHIEGCELVGNRFAGITLYKNCGESGTPRRQGADHNVIAGNVFRHHHHPEGAALIVASRQRLDPVANDCLADECVDAPLEGTGLFRDYARDNVVRDNLFEENVVGLRVLDGPNVIEDNRFRGREWRAPAAPGGALAAFRVARHAVIVPPPAAVEAAVRQRGNRVEGAARRFRIDTPPATH